MIRRISPKILLTLFTALLLGLQAQAQSDKVRGAEPFDFWVDHLPYNSFYHIAALDDRTFAATENSLLIVHQGEYERLSRINGLTGSNITALASDENSQTVWIGYANGRLDIWENGAIKSIVDIVETPSYTGLKQVNDFAFYNGKAYVATDFGVVEFDIATRLAGRTLLLGANYSAIPIQSFDISPDGTLCAYSPSNASNFYIGDVNSSLPNWTQRPYQLFPDNSNPDHITYFPIEERFIFACDDLTSGTYTLAMGEAGGNWSVEPYPSPFQSAAGWQGIQDLQVTGNYLIITRDFNVFMRQSTAKNTFSDSLNISNALFAPGVLRPTAATMLADQSIHIANLRSGVLRVNTNGSTSRYHPSSPYSASAFKLRAYGNGRNGSYSNPGGDGGPSFGGVMLLPGALNEIWTKAYLNEGPSYYTNQEWTFKETTALYGVNDIVDAAFTMLGTGASTLYLSSWGKGIVHLEGMADPTYIEDTIALYNTTNTDGALKGVNGNASDLRTGGLTFDDDGNLWGVQSLVSTPLFSRDAEGNWASYSLSPGADGVALKDIVHHDGMLFIQSRTNGIYGYRIFDGAKRNLSTGIGSGDLPSDHVLSMAIDHDGELWIGTDEGLVVLYSPGNLFNGGNADARPILFEEDGVVQKLLGETPITAIVVDGANQKWISTRGAGLFLIGADGLSTLQHFTAENSPLLSNNIQSLAIDPTSGEVVIATELGVIGYRGTATPGYLGLYPELLVYPNPIRPGYEGPILAQGCPENAQIKITDVSGGLVYETVAEGGQMRWDGVNHHGKKVASGVYLIYVSDDLGEITAMGKVLIVR